MATVICPNCGGENDVAKREGQECAYCGTLLHLPTPKEPTKKRGNKNIKQLSEAKYIIPIASQYSTREDIKRALCAYLVMQDDVPTDIADHLEIKSIEWLYLPMWRYNGTISTEWSCDEIVYRKRKVGEEPKYDSKGNFLRMETVYETYEDYLPKSGHGHTSFDILAPAIKKIKEKLPYRNIDFNIVSGVKQMKEGATLIPACASIRKATNEVDSEAVLIDVAIELKHKAEKCSYGGFIPRSSHVSQFLKDGRECTHEHLSFTYQFNENGTVGELYYVPLVYVIYSYKGETYEWGFMLTTDNTGSYDTPISTDDSIDEDIDKQKEEHSRLSVKWNVFLFLSGVFTFLVGMLIFLVRNISLYERIGKRYRYQESLVSLLGIYKRRENLIKHGADKKTIAEINAQIQEEYGDGEEDEDEEFEDLDERTPKNIAEISQYFAATEALKQKLQKRMRRFWVGYITLIVIVGGSILGYILYNNWKSEKYNAELTAIQEAEDNRLINEITQRFNTEIVGNRYEGESTGFETDKLMKIHILDNSRLQYQIGKIGDFIYEGNSLSRERKWESPKTVSYTLSVEPVYDGKTRIGCYIKFDGYTSKNILKDNDVEEFDEKIIVPLKESEKAYSNLDTDYQLKRK